ncbi:hypothetical protein [Roseococcus sp. YIM B11640]|uniref:hypothetical protein n=1 Tax=Roseococcus sp. YIM B11640 TaxID=3133973 RepID=UPI003C7E0987
MPVSGLTSREVREEFRDLRIRQTELRLAVQRAEARLDADWTSEQLSREADEAWRRLVRVNHAILRLRREYPAELGTAGVP